MAWLLVIAAGDAGAEVGDDGDVAVETVAVAAEPHPSAGDGKGVKETFLDCLVDSTLGYCFVRKGLGPSPMILFF